MSGAKHRVTITQPGDEPVPVSAVASSEYPDIEATVANGGLTGGGTAGTVWESNDVSGYNEHYFDLQDRDSVAPTVEVSLDGVSWSQVVLEKQFALTSNVKTWSTTMDADGLYILYGEYKYIRVVQPTATAGIDINIRSVRV